MVKGLNSVVSLARDIVGTIAMVLGGSTICGRVVDARSSSRRIAVKDATGLSAEVKCSESGVVPMFR